MFVPYAYDDLARRWWAAAHALARGAFIFRACCQFAGDGVAVLAGL
jgi:hypothetical protein